MRLCHSIVGLLLLLAACEPQPGAEQASLEQCAGNHPADSLALWFQWAREGFNMPGVTVGNHPALDCIAIGIGDSTQVPDIEAELERLGIPRNAAVIAVDTGE